MSQPTATYDYGSTLNSHPSTAEQAKAFTSSASLAFPGGAAQLTPPNEKEVAVTGTQGTNGTTGPEVAPATPAATPGAAGSGHASGITPTLQSELP